MRKKINTLFALLIVVIIVSTVVPARFLAAKKVASTKITKVVPTSKSVLLKWKKIKSVKGYQVQYSTSSKFKSATKITIRDNSINKQFINKLIPNKNYYIRVRTYIKENKTASFSKWSSKTKVHINGGTLIGHRGYSSEYPENTIEAFDGAITNNFDGIEIDVWEANNGDIMVFHDKTTKRMCGISKYAWKINSDNRKKYPIIGGNNIKNYPDGLMIPTLEETIDFVKARKCKLYIHIKDYRDKGYELSKKGANKIVKLINNAGLKGNTIVFGSKKNIAHFLNKSIKTGYMPSGETRKQLDEHIKWCVENNVKSIVIFNGGFNTFKNPENGKSLVKACHKSGITIGLYTTETKAQYKYLDKIGADFAMSDYKLN